MLLVSNIPSNVVSKMQSLAASAKEAVVLAVKKSSAWVADAVCALGEIWKELCAAVGSRAKKIWRFLMELLDINNVREAILFPRDRTRLTP